MFRKKLYSKLSDEEADRKLADMYHDYVIQENIRIKAKELEWNETIELYNQNGEEPDFRKSLKNNLYDLKQKSQQEVF